jgi:hypothetical protein
VERECFLCGSRELIEAHHIFGGANRKKADRLGLVVDLCHYHHNEPPYGAHHNKGVMRRLKQYGQKKAMLEQGWSKEDFIREFGKNYLEDE